MLTFHSNKNHNPSCDILVKQLDIDTSITFGIYVKDTDKYKKGKVFMELYIGNNYNVGSKKRSYSRYYEYKNIPKKHFKQWLELETIYKEQYS